MNTTTNQNSTPLHYAVYKRHKEISYLLLNAGADVNTVNNNGETPLMTAQRYNDQDIANLISDFTQDQAPVKNFMEKHKEHYDKQKK